jgi:hypothetical protein
LNPNASDLISVTLSFTSEDQLVVGLTLEGKGNLPETDEKTRE